jgi:hypothetical protein
MRNKRLYQWILFSLIIGSLASCGFLSKKRKLLKSSSFRNHFPQGSYEGFHSHPARNLSQNCLEGQFALTEPQTGKQRCSKLPKTTILRNLSRGHKAYQCKVKTNPLYLKKGFLRDLNGVGVDPKSFRCPNGVAFLEKRKHHTKIHCLSEDPYYDPLRKRFTSPFEHVLRSCH